MALYRRVFNPVPNTSLVPSGNVITFKTSVANFAALPLVGNTQNDARITSDNGHLYVWDGSTWIDQGDIVDLEWAAISDKPTSSVADIDDAVSKRHASGSDNQDADAVPFTPDGDISATDVQAAVVEVRDDTDIKLTNITIPDISDLANQLKILALNIMLNAFRLAISTSASVQSMINSFVDEYEDESGIDLGDSINQYYDTNLDMYTTAQPQGSTVVLLHGNGSNGSPSIIDEKGHTVINSGTTLTTGTSKFGGASINCPVAYCQINDNIDTRLGTGDWTIDGWFNLEPGQGTAAFRPFYTLGGDSSANDLIVYRSGGVNNYNLGVGGGLLDAPINTGFSLPQGSWFHLALTRFGNTITVYVDGVSKGSTTTTGNFTNGLLYIGGKAVGGGGDNYFGKIDEFRVVKGAAMWTAPFTPETAEYTGNEGTFDVSNITLISNPQSASVAPTTARLVLFQEDIDAGVLNTDIKGYVSRDGGATYTQVTLAEEGYYTMGQRILSGNGDVSAQPSGTNMVYKITTHNNKNLNFHGTGMLWN